ncbi:MAG: flagella basal body P-ring formation protein FlgA [Deltaproteobacteria bacterium]|nr:flagella basal body P-ring formation protein FlgA [Deltaproteobacteria bacterium]
MRGVFPIALLLAFPASALAQEHITLDEVLPALAGTELGRIELGPAPPPGSSRTVRGSEVRAALRAQGRDARGLAIPSATRVRRDVRRIARSELEALVRPRLDEAIAPCRAGEVELPDSVSLATGEVSVAIEASAPSRSGRVAAAVVLASGGRETRLTVSAAASCPPPIVSPGARVSIIARFGNVTASAPGVAMQPGRVGDVIRVTNRSTRASLMARIESGDTVRVVQ